MAKGFRDIRNRIHDWWDNFNWKYGEGIFWVIVIILIMLIFSSTTTPRDSDENEYRQMQTEEGYNL